MARPHRCKRFQNFEGDRVETLVLTNSFEHSMGSRTIRLIFGDFGLAGSARPRPRYRDPKRSCVALCPSDCCGVNRRAKFVFTGTKRLPAVSARSWPSSPTWARHAKSGCGSVQKTCPFHSTTQWGWCRLLLTASSFVGSLLPTSPSII